MQCAKNIIIIKPKNFGFNSETAYSNAFQQKIEHNHINATALNEFNNFAVQLTVNSINFTSFDDTNLPIKPDAVFPNNWCSLHHNGTIILYPMQALNRQYEKRLDIIEQLKNTYCINDVIDLSSHHTNGKFLEGTGSIVFNHVHKIAYACISSRTDESLFIHVCNLLSYTPIYFTAVDDKNIAIYHTNVLMSIGDGVVVICIDAVNNKLVKAMLLQSFKKSNLEVVTITLQQMKSFAGNMLMVQNIFLKKIMALSLSAYHILQPQQIKVLEKYCYLMPIAIPTIETVGGGSIRCMIAENFLPTI
jgi:hypothetical protein